MWLILFSPEMLFGIGALLAMVPYVLWYWLGLNPSYSYVITYIPIAYWTAGYAAFFGGARLAKRRRTVQLSLLGSTPYSLIKLVAWVVFGALLIQVIAATVVYGGVPLLKFGGGGMHIEDVQRLQEERAGFGQLGALTMTIFLANAVILVVLLEATETRRKIAIALTAMMALIVFASTMAGKRQGLVMTFVYLGSGLALRCRHPTRAVLTAIGAIRGKTIRLIVIASMGLLFVWFMGAVSVVRTRGNNTASGIDQLSAYLEMPLINFESQCSEGGYGPYAWNPLELVKYLLPNRSIEGVGGWFNPPPRKPEPTSPSGFFAAFQWGVGLAGAVVFCFFCGAGCRMLYDHSGRSVLSVLLYSQVTWALISGAEYNHFLNLVYVLGPAILIICLNATLGMRRRRSVSTARELRITRTAASRC